MKIQTIISVLTIVTNTLSAQKVDSTLAHLTNAYHNVVRITPLQFIWGKMSVGYERGIDDRKTASIELQLWKEDYSIEWGSLLGFSRNHMNKGYRVSASMRFYPEKAFHGFYTQVGVFTGKHDITTFSAVTIVLLTFGEKTHVFNDVWSSGVKAGVGYHVMKGRLSFDMGLGAGFAATNNKRVVGKAVQGVFLTSRLGVGLAF